MASIFGIAKKGLGLLGKKSKVKKSVVDLSDDGGPYVRMELNNGNKHTKYSRSSICSRSR